MVSSSTDKDAAPSQRMRLRYAGRCRTCSVDLPARTEAVYDRVTKTVMCLPCLDEGGGPTAGHAGPVVAEPVVAEPVAAGPVEAAVDVLPRQEPVPAGEPEVPAGAPGSSARREYERRKAKREARIRKAHPRLGGVILALTDDPQSTRAWGVGARGEELLGRNLDKLADRGVRVLHDRRIPRTKANIDHVAVGPSGVHVIDAKNYRGRPELRVEGGLFRAQTRTLVVGSRDCTKLVTGVHRQVKLVRAALDAAGHSDVPVSGMLCFVEADWPLIGGSFTVDEVAVLWPRKAGEKLVAAGPLDPARVAHVHRVLAEAFPPA